MTSTEIRQLADQMRRFKFEHSKEIPNNLVQINSTIYLLETVSNRIDRKALNDNAT